MEEQKNRLSVIGAVYYETADAQPEGAHYAFSRELETDDQVYKRNLTATKEWRPLDCGWLDDCSMLVIVNNEGKFTVNPTDEEQEEASEKVLEVCYDYTTSYYWLIPVGESMQAYPSDASKLFIRCRSGDAKFTVHLFPR